MSGTNVAQNADIGGALSLDGLPISTLQAIYHAATGKTESLTKRINGNVLVQANDIDRLYLMLMQQIENIEKPVPPTVTVVVKTEEAKIQRHSSWEHFKTFRTNEYSVTSEISLKIEMLISLPSAPAPQRLSIVVNLDSALPMLAHENYAPGPSLIDYMVLVGEEWRTCRVSVDFVDFLVAQRFTAAVEEWFQQLERMEKSKLNSLMLKGWRIIRDTAEAMPFVGFAIFLYTYSQLNPSLPTDLGSPLRALSLAVAILSLLYLLRNQFIHSVMSRLTRNVLPSVIILTTGDDRRFKDYKKKRTSAGATFAAWLALPVITVLLNVASNYIYDFIR